MQRLKLLGLALIAVFTVSVFASAAALAAPTVLTSAKKESEAVKFSATNQVNTTTFSILEGLGVVECKEISDEGEQTGKTLLGLFHIHWKGCKVKGFSESVCTGLGDEAGLVLALGTFHIVLDKLGTGEALGLGILFLLEHVHFLCDKVLFGANILVLVLGEVLCLLGPLTLGTKKTITCEGTESGDPRETVYWNERGTEVKMGENGLLGSENEGTNKMSAQNGKAEVTTNLEVEFMD
jgi:hypothetical protein